MSVLAYFEERLLAVLQVEFVSVQDLAVKVSLPVHWVEEALRAMSGIAVKERDGVHIYGVALPETVDLECQKLEGFLRGQRFAVTAEQARAHLQVEPVVFERVLERLLELQLVQVERIGLLRALRHAELVAWREPNKKDSVIVSQA